MGHVGLTPQTATALGGYRAQGRTAEPRAVAGARTLGAGGRRLLLARVRGDPAAVASELMPRCEVPVIGIGAGSATDGQVLVFHDLLGIHEGLARASSSATPTLKDEMVAGVRAYADDVRAGRFPGPEHAYSIDPEELTDLRAALDAYREPTAAGGAASGA